MWCAMHDAVQRAVEALALHNLVVRVVLTLCAAVLVYPLALAWLVVVARRLDRVSVRAVARGAVLIVLALAASRVFAHLVVDPRPYLVTHTAPLTPTARDNGFPSDHVLLAAALAVSLWWLDRRWLPAFAAGVVLVMLGRLGVGAHHTLDVLGSVVIVVGAALVAAALPLPVRWSRPVVAALRRQGVTSSGVDIRRGPPV